MNRRSLAARVQSLLGLALLAGCGSLSDDVSLGKHDHPGDQDEAGAPQGARFPTQPPLSPGAPAIFPHREAACDEPTECVGVEREPWITTGLGEFSLGDIVLDETHLYFTTWSPDQTAIWRAHRVSGEKERLLVTAAAGSLALDDTHVYFADGEQVAGTLSIVRMPKDGGTVELLVSEHLRSAHVAVDDTHVYFNGIVSNIGVYRVAKDGGEPELLAPVEEVANFRVGGPYLVVTGAQLGRIQRVPITGGAAMTLFDSYSATELAVGNGFAYFVHVSDEDCPPCQNAFFRLARVPLSGGQAEELHARIWRPGAVATRSDAVIWGNWFLPHDGSTPSRLVPDEYWITRVAADDSDIFIGSHYGNIYKIVQ